MSTLERLFRYAKVSAAGDERLVESQENFTTEALAECSAIRCETAQADQAAEGLVVVTHDRGLARRCLLAGTPHLWLRTREPQDRERIREALPAIEEAFAQGSVRVVASQRALIAVDATRVIAGGG
jgi:predicted nuclease of predicted toxin-antitoxin system